MDGYRWYQTIMGRNPTTGIPEKTNDIADIADMVQKIPYLKEKYHKQLGPHSFWNVNRNLTETRKMGDEQKLLILSVANPTLEKDTREFLDKYRYALHLNNEYDRMFGSKDEEALEAYDEFKKISGGKHKRKRTMKKRY
jgi:hypothetical protein